MAVSLERFSIREYSAQMRSVDIAKCWPFRKDDSLKSLPPISVPKFHWWADELEARRRNKQRAPNKRSIVELFNASPEIEADEGDEWNVDTCLRESGKRQKPFHLLKYSVCKNQFEKTLMDPGDHPNQKFPVVNNSTQNCNYKDTQRLNLIPMQQDVRKSFPTNGILKNQTRTTSAKHTTAIGEMQDEKLSKLVTFSNKDDIVRAKHEKYSSFVSKNGLPLSEETNDSRQGDKISYAVEGDLMENEKDKDVITNLAEKKHVRGSCNHSDSEEVFFNETSSHNYRDFTGSDSGKQQTLNSNNEEGSTSVGGNTEQCTVTTSVGQSSIFPTENGISESYPTLSWATTSVPLQSCLVMSRKANEGGSDFSSQTNISFVSHILKTQANRQMTPGLNFTESPTIQIREMQRNKQMKDQLNCVHCYSDPENFGDRSTGFNQNHNYSVMERVPSEGVQLSIGPTIHLMGKDEIIGENSNEYQHVQQKPIAPSVFGTSERSLLLPAEPHSLYFPSMQFRSVGIASNGISTSIGDLGLILQTESHSQDVHGPTSLNFTNCRQNQSLCNDRSMTYPVSFPTHNHGNFTRPFSVSSPCYQWPVNLKDQRNQKTTSLCSDPFVRQDPYAWSPYPSSMFSFPICITNDIGASNPTSVAQPSRIPASPTSGSTSAVNENMMKNNTYFGGVYDANLSRKRPAGKSGGFSRPKKKSNLTENSDSCPPFNLLGYGYQRTSMNFQVIDKNKDANNEFRTSSGPLKHGDGLSKVVILRAGAKHILKLCRDVGTDSGRSLHSIVPFEIGTSFGTNPISLEKTTKIYSF